MEGKGLRESSLDYTVADSGAEVNEDGVGTKAGGLEAARGERAEVSRGYERRIGETHISPMNLGSNSPYTLSENASY
jgi:hypothetical protein